MSGLAGMLRYLFSVLLAVSVGLAYYTMTELLDRQAFPLLVDQGRFVLAASDPVFALHAWNFVSYLVAITTSGLPAAGALLLFSRYGHWMETLPAAVTATTLFVLASFRQVYFQAPLVYILAESTWYLLVLPGWFLLLQRWFAGVNSHDGA